MTESTADKVARFQKALRLFLDRLRADPHLLAAVLVIRSANSALRPIDDIAERHRRFDNRLQIARAQQ